MAAEFANRERAAVDPVKRAPAGDVPAVSWAPAAPVIAERSEVDPPLVDAIVRSPGRPLPSFGRTRIRRMTSRLPDGALVRPAGSFGGPAVVRRVADGQAAQVFSPTEPTRIRPMTARLPSGAPVRPARSSTGPTVVQRITAPQATQAIAAAGIPNGWYNNVAIPSLQGMAVKANQTWVNFLGAMTPAEFMQKVNELRADVKAEPKPLLASLKEMFSAPAPGPPAWADSNAYPGFRRFGTTNLFALRQGNFNAAGAPTAALATCTQRYRAGTLLWYRGIPVNSFAWHPLRRGVLASEGTADIPGFTMGNADPTRWLPGVNAFDLAHDVGLSPQSGSNPGLAVLANANPGVPVGAVIEFLVPDNHPVAFLNEGELVVRGPLIHPAFTIRTVVVISSVAVRDAVGPFNPNQLPNRAPYGKPVNDPAILAWAGTPAAPGAIAWGVNNP